MMYCLSLLLFSFLPYFCYNLQISAPPTHQIVPLGSSVSFSCTIQQTPDLFLPYTLQWMFDGTLLDLSPPSGVTRRSSSESSLTATLLFIETVWMDSGLYSCQLFSNGSSVTSDSARLEFATLADTFLTSPESKSPMVGEGPVYLFCSHGDSNPRANITWLKNSQPDTSLTFTTTTLTVATKMVASSTLTISQAKPSDIGAYTCVATNSYIPGEEVHSDTALLMVGSETTPPVWIKHPHGEAELPIVNGTAVELVCTVFANPTPGITWERDGSDLADSTELTLSTGVQSSYSISTANESDEGSYRCRALNILGLSYSNAVLLRLAFLLETFSENPGNTTVFQGQEAYLKCRPPSSFPSPVVTWSRGAVQVQGAGYEVTLMGDLVIASADFVDTGEYSCTATNPSNSAQITSQTAYLLVASPIELTTSSDLVQPLIDSEVVISCINTGIPTPSLSWTRDSTLLPSSLYPEITVSGNQLSIRNVSLAHEGYFMCSATNQVETQAAQIFIDVIQPPTVTAVITELTTREGYLSILTCVASGDPQPVVSWSEEGESNSSTLSSRHTVYTNGSLVISDTNRSDTGSYVCRGSNVGGEDQDTISLNVLFPPRITSQLSEQLVAPGESISLLCTAEANPAPQVSWEGPNGTVSGSGSGLLTLTSVQPNADGEYSCVATNVLGSDSLQIRIIVTVPPQVSITGGSQSVIEGQSTSIQCQILSGNPVPEVSWFRDDQMLTQSLPSISISLSEQGSTLSISPALRSHTSLYTCKGVNAVGSSESSVLITVLSAPATPQILSLLARATSPPAPDTTSLFLNWTMEDDGGSPVLSYVIRYTALLATPSLTQEAVVPSEPREVIIDSLMPYTTYEVQIYARNLIGVSPFSDPETIRSLILYPSTPRGILLSSPGPYTLTVSWEEPVPSNGPVAFYEIQYQLFTGSQTTNKIEFLEVIAEVLTANLTGLMPQSAYSISIRAKNRDEQGNLLIGQFSQAILGDTGFQAPSNPPTIITLSAASSVSIRVNWVPPDVDIAAPVTSYVIYITTVSQVVPPAPGPTEISALYNTTEIGGLFPYTQYLVSMASSNSKGSSPTGSGSSVTTEEDIPTSPAANITLASYESTTIQLNWQDPPFIQVRGNIVRYDIHYKRTDEDREFDIIRSDTKSATITGLMAYTEYDVSVAIVTGVGSGPRNDPPLVQRTAEGLPTAPTGLSVEIEATSVRLNWAQPATKNGLLIQYTITLHDTESADILALDIPTTNEITDPFLSIDGLVPGTNYTFSISASTGAGAGVISETFAFSTPGVRPTAPPPLTVTVIVTVTVTATTASTHTSTSSQATDSTTQTTTSLTTTTKTSTAANTTQSDPSTNDTRTSTTVNVTNSTSESSTASTPIPDTTTQATETTTTTREPTIFDNLSLSAVVIIIVIISVIIAIVLILMFLLMICLGMIFVRKPADKVKAGGFTLRGLTDPVRSRPNSVSSSRRPHSLTLSNPYHAISRGATSSRNPQSERSWYTSVRSPPKSDTMDTLQDMVAEKERQRADPGNLFTPYGYRPPALGAEPTPSPTGMSKKSGRNTPEVQSNSYSHEGMNVDRERKQLSSQTQQESQNGVFIFDKVQRKPKDWRLDTSGGSDPPSLPPRRYIQEEPDGLRLVLDEGLLDELDTVLEREEDYRL